MSFSVNTNPGAFAALQNLNRTSASLDVTQTRINTGLKVSSAKDNAAVYSIAQNLRSDVAGFNAVNNSLDRARSELDVAIAAGEAISDLLIEMKEKAVAAKDTGLDASSRTALNDDYQELLSQIDSIANNATFNGKNLLTGDTLSAITDASGDSLITSSNNNLTASDLSLDTTDISTSGSGSPNTQIATGIPNAITSGDPVGALNNYMSDNFSAIYNNGTLYNQSTGGFVDFLDAADVATAIAADFGVGVSFTAGIEYNLFLTSGTLYTEGSGASAAFTTNATSSSGGADAAVDAIEAAISSVNDTLSELGSTANRLAVQQSFAGKLSDGLEVGIGNLVDADLAKESANLQAFQTKQQLGLQALSIANQAPSTVLSLFR